MNIKNLFLPNYSIGTDAYKNIEGICINYGKKAVIIGGEKSISVSKDGIIKNVKNIKINGILHYGGVASYENVDILKNKDEVKEADMIFAVGGGKSLDTSKTLADLINKPIFAFPTLASNCASVTSLSVMYNADGSFKDLFHQKRPPIHTFIDSNIILNSPERYFIAGIGDAASKQYETEFSIRNENLDYNNFLGYQIIKNCSNDIMEYAVQSLNDFRDKKSSDILNRIVLHIIYTTGLTSVTMKDDYHISLAHAMYNGLTKIKSVSENLFHGEMVAYGILLLLTLDNKNDDRNKVFNFNKSLGLPTSIKNIGIANNKKDINFNNEYLNLALEGAIAAKDLNISPYKIDKDMILKAIIDLENYNNSTI